MDCKGDSIENSLYLYQSLRHVTIRTTKFMNSTNQRSLIQLLNVGHKNRFYLEAYLSYEWNSKKVTSLFEDLWQLSIDRIQVPDRILYMGPILTYSDKDFRYDVRFVDIGHSHLITFSLLLRAILYDLEKTPSKKPEDIKYIRKIQHVLWQKPTKIGGEPDRSKLLLISNMSVDGVEAEILQIIIETGEVIPNSEDNYSKNYNILKHLYATKKQSNSLNIYNFIESVLNYVMFLHIEGDDMETAWDLYHALFYKE